MVTQKLMCKMEAWNSWYKGLFIVGALYVEMLSVYFKFVCTNLILFEWEIQFKVAVFSSISFHLTMSGMEVNKVIIVDAIIQIFSSIFTDLNWIASPFVGQILIGQAIWN